MKSPLRTLALSVLSLLPALPGASLGPVPLRHAIRAPAVGVRSGAKLGSSVAVDAGYAVVGVPDADTGAAGAGAVRVFDSVTGALLFILSNPSPEQGARFGQRVAISGSRIVISAPFAHTASGKLGRVYVYDLSEKTPMLPVTELKFLDLLDQGGFHLSVAISGKCVVVGVLSSSSAALREGGAYIYDLGSATSSVPVLTLHNPSPAESDHFGMAVGISGMRVVVGAPGDNTGASNAGSAYVYDVDSATPTSPVVTLSNPSPAPGDYFGMAVGISGTRMVVGASCDDTGAGDSGSAYVYDLGSATPTLPAVILNNPAPQTFDYFGTAVAMSGSRVLVGAPSDSDAEDGTGSAYLYDLDSVNPALPAVTLEKETPGYDQFGSAVAIAGTRVLVGIPGDSRNASRAGSAAVYELTSATPTVPTLMLEDDGASLNDKFGYAVAVSGTLMVVGAPKAGSGAGSAYIYDLGSALPTVPLFTLHDQRPGRSDKFGWAVAISGTRVVVGSPFDTPDAPTLGTAYVYDLSGETPTVPVDTLLTFNRTGPTYFGFSVAISETRVVVGAPREDTSARNAGSVYVFDLGSGTSATLLMKLNNPSPVKNDYFGWSVAISDQHVAVGTPYADLGASNAGRVYVYDLGGANPRKPVARLNNPSPAENDRFGHSVAISGGRVLTGAPNDDKRAVNSGRAYLYDLDGATPRLPALTLRNPSPTKNDNFGYSVALSGERMVVGAYRDDNGAKDTGTAYVFDLSSVTPSLPVLTLAKPIPVAGDRFGRSVSIDGSTVVVGTPRDDTRMLDKGAVFVFGP